MRILVTNDDGINAEGLEALERIARALSDDVWIVAPEYEQSGASRALTLDEPIRIRKLGSQVLDHRHADGLRDAGRPRTGAGGAARSGPLGREPGREPRRGRDHVGHGRRGHRGHGAGHSGHRAPQMGFYEPGASYEAAETFGPGIVKRLVELGWPGDVVLNINFPNRPVEEIQEVEVTRQGFRDVHVRHAEKRTDLRGKEYYWVGFRQERSSPPEGTDLRALYDGKISVTPLHIDLTHNATLRDLKGQLGGVPPKV